MTPVTNVGGFMWGAMGGFSFTIGECLLFRKQMPGWVASLFYWTVGLGVAAFGGGLVLMHLQSESVSFSPIVSFHIGTWAPLFLSIFAKHAPHLDPGKKID